MLPDQTRVDDFVEFVGANEDRLRHALTAAFGLEVSKEAAAEALAGWEHWEKVRAMANPVGYLCVVGRSKGLYSRPVFPPIPEDRTPWFEPGLPAAQPYPRKNGSCCCYSTDTDGI